MAARASASGTTNLSESGKASPSSPFRSPLPLSKFYAAESLKRISAPTGTVAIRLQRLSLRQAHQIADRPVFLELQVFLRDLGARQHLDVLQLALDLPRAHFGLVDGVGHRLE